MMTSDLQPDDQVQFVKGVGPERAEHLENLDIYYARDLLFHLPLRYEKQTRVHRIADLLTRDSEGEVVVEGQIRSLSSRPVSGGKHIVECLIADDTGSAKIAWFHSRYLMDKLERGESIRITGEPEIKSGGIKFTHPDFDYPVREEDDESNEESEGEETRTVPVYPSTEGISQKKLRSCIQNAMDAILEDLSFFEVDSLLEDRSFYDLPTALETVHKPNHPDEAREARRSIAYHRALPFFVALLQSKQHLEDERSPFPIQVNPRIDERIRNRFPFQLTDAQEEVIEEIRQDFRANRPVYRLLQGDVGSGKTVVALYGILSAIASQYQTAMMAPTSVLAEQHYRTVDRYLSDSSVTYEYLSGSVTGKKRKNVYEGLQSGDIDLVIGTHALIEEDVQFEKLGFVVIDEQQRFGVRHRTKLVDKSEQPHILVTTATPIPRTMTLTVYGDLDISIIDEMPPGRKPVETRLGSRRHLEATCDFIRNQIDEGNQAFFVYPLIEESEQSQLTSAKEMYERLRRELLPEANVGLLHGDLRDKEKTHVMETFRKGETDILVSTVVIEVGVDVPGATVMVIDHAEQFGLSQLHQLRGRIGRGSNKSFCLLLADDPSEKAKERLNFFQDTDDGFKIAEKDLEMRGPGTLMGTRQHGTSELKFLEIASDPTVVKAAREDARRLLEEDPDLEEHTRIKEYVEQRYEDSELLFQSG